MADFFFNIISIICSMGFLLGAESISVTLKVLVTGFLFIRGFRHDAPIKSLTIALILLTSSIMIDTTWIIWLVRSLIIPSMDYRIVVFFIRISWAFSVIQYQSLALFVESLLEKNYTLSLHQRFFMVISTCFCAFFLIMAMLHYNNPFNRPDYEYTIEKISSLYLLLPLMLTTLTLTIRRIYQLRLPKILKKQLKIIFNYIIAPYLISDFLQIYPFSFMTTNGNFAMVAISSSLLTFAIYYTSKKIMGLRFLNMNNHVIESSRFNFIQDFKDILEQLSQATSLQEIHHINQHFFKEAFGIKSSACTLSIRKQLIQKYDPHNAQSDYNEAVEHHIIHNPETISYFYRQKILVADEIAFNNFYEKESSHKTALNFLNALQCSVFIPIFNNTDLIAWITITADTEQNRMYSNVEQDEMVLFASYLGNIIYLILHQKLSLLLHKRKSLQDEIYQKHDIINRYKESIHHFLQEKEPYRIGVIFYKNNRFTYGNADAHDIVAINLNIHVGHYLTHALKNLAQQVELYKTAQSITTFDAKGNKILCTCLPNAEQSNLIMLLYHPGISEVIKERIELLKNPSEWEYILYLETTSIGEKINQFIPGNQTTLLNAKVDFLKNILGIEALLINAADDDIKTIGELIKLATGKEQVHNIKLHPHLSSDSLASLIFGMNPIFSKTSGKPLLSTLNNSGILMLHSIEHLPLEIQDYLAEYLQYGFYHLFKSEQKLYSNVRIVCITHQNLAVLVQEKKFSEALYKILHKKFIALPSLHDLPEDELTNLAEEYMQQLLSHQNFHNFFKLTAADQDRLQRMLSPSFTGFREQIRTLIDQKSKRGDELLIDHHETTHTIQLTQAASLGKKALQDKTIMIFLWENFKNQNKIATFLGVNRSSVNRRCKEFNLV